MKLIIAESRPDNIAISWDVFIKNKIFLKKLLEENKENSKRVKSLQFFLISDLQNTLLNFLSPDVNSHDDRKYSKDVIVNMIRFLKDIDLWQAYDHYRNDSVLFFCILECYGKNDTLEIFEESFNEIRSMNYTKLNSLNDHQNFIGLYSTILLSICE